MSPESLLAEKLAAYRSIFDDACRGLFSSGEGVTLEYEHDDDDDAVDVAAAEVVSEPSFENSNTGSNSAKQIRAAVRSIADDFAREFNAKLAAAATSDPTVALVADKYQMGAEHVAELDELLARPIAPLLGKLSAGDLDGARRETLEAWPLLERRIRAKWQAYFVLTFQDVSVERKAARDRRKLQPRFDEASMSAMVNRAEAVRRTMTDFAAPVDERPRSISPWVIVVALLALAAAGGWMLVHVHAQRVAAGSDESGTLSR